MNVEKIGAGRYRHTYYDEHGQRRRPVYRVPTKERAEDLAREVETDVARRKRGVDGIAPNPLGWSVGDACAWWLTTWGKKRADPTRERGSVKGLITSHPIAAKRADLLRSTDVEAHLLHLEEQGYKAESVNHARRYLHTIFRRAQDAGKLQLLRNPVDGTEPREVPAYAWETLTLDEVRVVLDAEDDDDTRAIYACAILAGLRRGELRALRVPDVDMEAGTIRVAASGKRNRTKGGKVRVLPIHPELRPHLARVLLTRSSGLLFPSPTTGGMRSASWKAARDLQRLMARVGLTKHLRFHDLRHTALTLLLQAGVSLAVAQRVAGHASPATTANTYGHLLVEDLKRGMAQVSIPAKATTTKETA